MDYNMGKGRDDRGDNDRGDSNYNDIRRRHREDGDKASLVAGHNNYYSDLY
jgi:hypothetical protein